MFQGFKNLKSPEYEVITPHTHLSFTVQSLTVQKEQRLKGSLVTPMKITEHLNKIIWECIVDKPNEIKTYNDFLNKLTLKDRESILFGIYHISYGEIRNYSVKCNSCAKEFPITISASSTFNFNPYPSNDILTKIIKIPLPKTKSVFAYIKQPLLIDEINTMKNISTDNELISVTLPINKFTQEDEGGGEIIAYDNRSDIIDAYLSLTPMDKKIIFDEYSNNFGNYGISLKCKTYCPNCGFSDIINIDLVEQFFRSVFTI